MHSVGEAVQTFRQMRFSKGLSTAIGRLAVWSDPLAFWSWGRRSRLAISVQEYVSGSAANIMVACWRGEILGYVAVEAVSCLWANGPSTVVRLIDNPEMIRAARLIAGRLKISGFFGLDFIMDEKSGKPYLIEMNPRCTQLGHLPLPGQGDLAAVLCEKLTGRKRSIPEHTVPGDLIAFFPNAWRGAGGELWYRAYQDVSLG